MRNALHRLGSWTAPALVALVVGVGCTETNEPADAATVCTDWKTCVCKVKKDCGTAHTFACVKNACKVICTPATVAQDCEAGEVCEDSVCRKPGCASDAECPGQQCIGGSCAPAPAAAEVKNCIVMPQSALVREGKTKAFAVFARGENQTLAYKGEVTWSVDQAARGAVAAGVLTGGTEGGAVKVQATIGTTTCTAATATNFAAPPAGKLRVIVADLLTNAPVADAKVLMTKGNDTANATTDTSGVALLDSNNSTAKTVSVLTAASANYAWVTLADVQSNDLVVFLKPSTRTQVGFKGSLAPSFFDGLQMLNEAVHLALLGPSIPGNLLDVNFESLLGEFKETKIDLGGGNAPVVPLPGGVVIGIGDQMFKQDFEVFVTPGIRTVWGLGGNAKLSEVITALGPVLSGGTENIDVGQILNMILPMLGKLQSGALTGLQSPTDDVLQAIDPKLTTPLRLRVNAKVPQLPVYKVNGTDLAMEGAVVLGGSLYGNQGLVPLGLTAGIDKGGAQDPGDRLVNNPEPEGVAGTLPLRMAPAHSGLELGKYTTLALAMNFSGLMAEEGQPAAPLALTGLVHFPDNLKYSAAAPVEVVLPAFMNVPAAPTVSGRRIAVNEQVVDAKMHRLDIGSNDTGEWFVYFPAGGNAAVDVPEVPAALGLDDRYAKPDADGDLPGLLLQSISLKPGTPADSYEKVVDFDGEDLNDLTADIDKFSARELVRPAK